jgi:type VII secretion system ESX-1 transmembrane protein EccB
MMPRNYALQEKVSRWLFSFHRLPVTVRGRVMQIIHDRSKNTSAALLALAVSAVPIFGLCFMLAVFNSAGQIGGSQVLDDQATGRWYDAPEGY